MTPAIKKRKRKGGLGRKDHLQLCGMALPAVVIIFVINYIPMAGVLLAFKNIDLSKGLLKSDWVGFDNFKYLFSTSDKILFCRDCFNTKQKMYILHRNAENREERKCAR